MATLKDLFDYQKFADNARMGNLIRDTESRYGLKEEDGGSDTDPRTREAFSRQSLSSSDLNYINAAGIPEPSAGSGLP